MKAPTKARPARSVCVPSISTTGEALTPAVQSTVALGNPDARRGSPLDHRPSRPLRPSKLQQPSLVSRLAAFSRQRFSANCRKGIRAPPSSNTIRLLAGGRSCGNFWQGHRDQLSDRSGKARRRSGQRPPTRRSFGDRVLSGHRSIPPIQTHSGSWSDRFSVVEALEAWREPCELVMTKNSSDAIPVAITRKSYSSFSTANPRANGPRGRELPG